MISISGTYVLILMVLVLILFGFHLVRECQKVLRQHQKDAQQETQAIKNRANNTNIHGMEQQLRHQENAWTRDTINAYSLDKIDDLSTKEKWIASIRLIVFLLFMFVLFYHNTYLENRAIKLAQEPKNLIHDCMFFDGHDPYKAISYFLIERKIYRDLDIEVEKFPAYQKLQTHRFEKKHCYKITYIKITIPVLNTERIYVYDIAL